MCPLVVWCVYLRYIPTCLAGLYVQDGVIDWPEYTSVVSPLLQATFSKLPIVWHNVAS